MAALSLVLAACTGDVYPDGGACNVLTNDGPVVTIQQVNSEAPEQTGGALTDGLYVLTASTRYTRADGGVGPSDDTTQSVTEIAGTTMRTVGRASPAGERRFTGPFTVEDSQLHFTPECPVASRGTATYSVTATGFTLCGTTSEGVTCGEFTRR